jgi:propanediol dehydratase small subunit
MKTSSSVLLTTFRLAREERAKKRDVTKQRHLAHDVRSPHLRMMPEITTIVCPIAHDELRGRLAPVDNEPAEERLARNDRRQLEIHPQVDFALVGVMRGLMRNWMPTAR